MIFDRNGQFLLLVRLKTGCYPSKMNISSEYISVDVDQDGAEIQSLKDLETGIEYIWQADSKFWDRHAPLLFPFVGKLKDDKFRVGNKYYSMFRHGFARDLEFEILEHKKDELTLRLDYSEETLKVYPFRFSLTVNYKVYGPKLFAKFKVENRDVKEMFFSIGSHPAFNIPLKSGTLEDYYIEFEQEEPNGAYYLQEGLINFDYKDDRTIYDGKKIHLSEKLFENDALVFRDPVSSSVKLKNIHDKHEIELYINGAPFLGIWKKPNAGFVCIEPWHGVADYIFSDHDLLKKEGIITLDKAETFSTEYQITVR